MLLRGFIIFCFTLLLSAPSFAKESITSFDVIIDVEKDGDIIVTENIALIKEGVLINRGIYRDLPRYYKNDGGKFPFQYEILSVTRNGQKEEYKKSTNGNAYKIKIGDADVMLENGPHTYSIKYRVENQVRYFDDYDEVYWNATGNYWDFPIDSASAQITLPSVSVLRQQSGYTGAQGSTAKNYKFSQLGNVYSFKTTAALQRREGFTIALGFEKGLIDPPSKAERKAMWWQKNGSLVSIISALLGILGFYLWGWNKVGRDPNKGPVFARYEPPQDYSPAAAHLVYYKGAQGHKPLVSSLLGLAVKKWISLDVDKKRTIISPLSSKEKLPDLALEERFLLDALFKNNNSSLTLDRKTNKRFVKAYTKFQKSYKGLYEGEYHKFNIGYILGGIGLSILAVILVFTLAPKLHSLYFFLTLGALFIANIVFAFLLPAPTCKGQDLKAELEGFKLYMETAEKLQLNTAKPGTDSPPAMSVKRYETFLPYAVALGVEKPWTKYFEKVMPTLGKAYDPSYARMASGNSLSNLNRSLVKNINSGVSKAMPSSSSGSGGGGSSGGGGGGGGGGGW